jgi:hypothetical protein
VKVSSVHTITVSPEELADRLGFDGTTVEATWEPEGYTIKIEGNAHALSMLPGPIVVAPAAPAVEVGDKPGAVLTVKFFFAPDLIGPAGAYAEELKREVMGMLNRVPEAGVSTVTTLVIG